MAKEVSTRVTCPEGICSFPVLFTAKKAYPDKPPVFSITVLWPKDRDMSTLEAAINAAMVKKWPDEESRPDNLKFPIKDGDLKKSKGKQRPEYKGMNYITTSCSMDDKPKVVDGQLRPILNSKDIYGGCLVNVAVNAYAFDKGGNKGVSLYLGHVQKAGDGEAFGAPPSNPEDDFAVLG